jgi:hypothetical protein
MTRRAFSWNTITLWCAQDVSCYTVAFHVTRRQDVKIPIFIWRYQSVELTPIFTTFAPEI